MLPLHHSDDNKQRVIDSLPPLLETIAWGSLAECLTSVGCPLRMFGKLDVTATVLNLVCPMLCGMAQAIDDAAVDTGADLQIRQRIAAFQAGFIGVATSFSFMAEQAALLGGPIIGLLYIIGTLVMTCAIFASGRVACAMGLRMKRLRRALRTGRLLLSAAGMFRVLMALVALTWVWVLIAPAGAVFEPLAVRQGQRGLDEHHGSADRPLPTSLPSKRADVLHLLVGLLMQAAGLALSARMEQWTSADATAGASTLTSPSGRRKQHGGWVRWPPLLCNGLACAVVLLLRTCESAAWIGGEDALFATKLRISGCGALSVCGGLATMLVAPAEPGISRLEDREGAHEGGLQQPSSSLAAGFEGKGGSTRRRQSARHVLGNLALHVQLAAATALLLPLLTDWAAGSSPSTAPSEFPGRYQVQEMP